MLGERGQVADTEIAQARRGCCTTFSAKFFVSLCVLVPLWLTIFHHGGTKTQRDTESFGENDGKLALFKFDMSQLIGQSMTIFQHNTLTWLICFENHFDLVIYQL